MSVKKKSIESHRATKSIKVRESSNKKKGTVTCRIDSESVAKVNKLKYAAITGREITVSAPEYHFLPILKKGRVSYAFREVNPLLSYLGYTQGDSSELLETDPSTISRWKNSKKSVDIGKLRSKVLLNLDEIMAKGIRIFGNEELFREWLNTTNYALGDIKPVDLLKDVYSMELVEGALDAMSWGDYL